ncbi:MAG: hypothetical protein V7767_11515 [Leeuwenhoekiella sp.]
MTTHYTIFIKKHNLKLKVGYRSGKFWRVERMTGTIPDVTLYYIGMLIPPKESDIPAFREDPTRSVTYTKIEKKKSIYTQFSDAWFTFYEEFAQIEPKFTGVEGKALKQIIVYLKKVSGSDEAALELWQVILSSWKHLDDFHKKNTDLKYINSSLNKIITNVKRISKTGTKGVSDDYLKSVINDLRT